MSYLTETDPSFQAAPPHRKPFLAGEWLRSQSSSSPSPGVGDSRLSPSVRMSASDGSIHLSESGRADAEKLFASIGASVKQAAEASDLQSLVLSLEQAAKNISDLLKIAGAAEDSAKLTNPERRRLLLSNYPGQNSIERAVSYLEAKGPSGFRVLEWRRKIQVASRFSRTGEVSL